VPSSLRQRINASHSDYGTRNEINLRLVNNEKWLAFYRTAKTPKQADSLSYVRAHFG